MGKISITASIVIYKTKKSDISTVIRCIDDSIIDRVYIVDNEKTNEMQTYVESLSNKVVYIQGQGNVGYGRANNIAIRKAIKEGSIYHIVMNPDIEFKYDIISTLKDYMDKNSDVGEIMPKILYPNGEIQYLCKLSPTPKDLIIRRFLPNKWCEKRKFLFEMRCFNYNEEMNVPFLSGCFMFLRLNILKEIGLFDERFFLYGEDIDLTRRIHKQYKTIYYPSVCAIHNYTAKSYKSKTLTFIHIYNIYKYFNKWGWFYDKERKRINNSLLQKCILSE